MQTYLQMHCQLFAIAVMPQCLRSFCYGSFFVVAGIQPLIQRASKLLFLFCQQFINIYSSKYKQGKTRYRAHKSIHSHIHTYMRKTHTHTSEHIYCTYIYKCIEAVSCIHQRHKCAARVCHRLRSPGSRLAAGTTWRMRDTDFVMKHHKIVRFICMFYMILLLLLHC